MWQYRGTPRSDTPATFGLLIAFAAVFIFIFFTGGPGSPLVAALAWPASLGWLSRPYLWQPLTFPFVHYGPWSVLFDALVLYFFGGSLERAWGGRRFLVFFFLSGIVAGIAVMAMSRLTGGALLSGMAGSFVAVTVAFAALNPYATVLFFFFPLQARLLAALVVALEIFANSGRYGGPVPAVVAVALVALFAWWSVRGGIGRAGLGTRGPSLKERVARWRQRRQWRRWQKEASRIQKPTDLFKRR